MGLFKLVKTILLIEIIVKYSRRHFYYSFVVKSKVFIRLRRNKALYSIQFNYCYHLKKPTLIAFEDIYNQLVHASV